MSTSTFIRFRAVENTTIVGICKGTFRVEGLMKAIRVDIINNKEKPTTIKRWIDITSSRELTRTQARKITDEMNDDIDNINKNRADDIIKTCKMAYNNDEN